MTDFVPPYTDTAADVRARMFATVAQLWPDPNNRPDLREPNEFWTILSGPALKFEEAYARLNEMLRSSFVQFSYGSYLDYRAGEAGEVRDPATGSSGDVLLLGTGGTIVPISSVLSTLVADASQSPITFATRSEVTLTAQRDPLSSYVPAIPIVATAGAAGNVYGDVIYKVVYVTELNGTSPLRGRTLPTLAYGTGGAANIALTVASKQVTVTVGAFTALTGTNLNVTKALVYRSYKPVGEVAFSAYKLVGTEVSTPLAGFTFTDTMSDSTFLLIDTTETFNTLPLTNTTGFATVTVDCQLTGIATNVAAGAVQTLSNSVPGVEEVTNPLAFTKGADAESDAALSQRLLDTAQASDGSGNVDTLVVWAKENVNVFNASVIPEWAGPGTVKVVLAGPGNSTITDPTVIEAVRLDLAGTIAIPAPLAATATAGSTTGGTILAGTYSYLYTYVDSGGGETTVSPAASVTLTGTTSSVVLTIPTIPSPAGTANHQIASMRVYRARTSDVGGGTYRLVTTSIVPAAPGSTTTVNDTAAAGAGLPQASLSTALAPTTNSTSEFNGRAPVGQHLTIVTITTENAWVTATIVVSPGYSISGEIGKVDLKASLDLALATFLQGVQSGGTVKFKDLENVLHDTPGVADFTLTKLYTTSYPAGVTSNLILGSTSTLTYLASGTVLTQVSVI